MKTAMILVAVAAALGGCGPDEPPTPDAGGAEADPSDTVTSVAPVDSAAAADSATPADSVRAPDSAAPADSGAPAAPADSVPPADSDAPVDPPAAEEDPHLTPDGWGPLRIGMSLDEVVAALGPDANPDAVGGPEPEACDVWRPERAPEGMIVMLERHRLTRITLVRGSPVTTAAGFGVGDERAVIEAAYGDQADVSLHKYMADDAAYITVWREGPDTPEPRGIVYEVGRDGRVSQIHAGGPSIRYVESCL